MIFVRFVAQPRS